MTAFLITLCVVLVLTLVYVIMGSLTYKRHGFNVWSRDIRYAVTALFAWAFIILLVGFIVAYFVGVYSEIKWRYVTMAVSGVLALLVVAFNITKLYKLNIECKNKPIAIAFTVLQGLVAPIVLITFLIVFLIRMGMGFHKKGENDPKNYKKSRKSKKKVRAEQTVSEVVDENSTEIVSKGDE